MLRSHSRRKTFSLVHLARISLDRSSRSRRKFHFLLRPSQPRLPSISRNLNFMDAGSTPECDQSQTNGPAIRLYVSETIERYITLMSPPNTGGTICSNGGSFRTIHSASTNKAAISYREPTPSTCFYHAAFIWERGFGNAHI